MIKQCVVLLTSFTAGTVKNVYTLGLSEEKLNGTISTVLLTL